MSKTLNRPNEIALATKQGIFFANIGRGQGLKIADLELHAQNEAHLGSSGQREASVFA